ncbi:hypothetical protein BCR33DRAFT_582034 [Rhizoclosmatium globosum]|uniref:Uncharacterized protein n=1 Tax=Rhizoclosmatium globosum TaxID=329046 RepID=A0A1Y2CR10_9FUNG|nr:hypothetical protein BCR33DRAFT_582034 [Rhizoclosmatium globosum]|eukprot:ORY49403.1 hypothetical protein BCR33DRAFT_582034 [Rhizoclosmatium globosum]
MEDQRQSSLFNPPDWGWAAVKGTPQLSSECQTYQSQFNRFQNSSFAAQLSKNHHTCQSTSTTAIILRLHTGSNLVFSPDMIHFIRSLITEAGYTLNHSIHLLVHHNHDSILTPSEKQSALESSPIPQEFHAICTVFTDGEMRQEFGDLVQGTPHSGDPNLALLWFLRRNAGVQFAWILEDDVRYIGRWRDLFAQVQDVWAKSRKSGKNSDKMPDLVAFEDICEPVEDWVWWKTCESIWGREKQRHTMGVIWGWSRELVNAMLEHIQAKQNCYYEVFPPSVAHNHGLSSLFIPIRCWIILRRGIDEFLLVLGLPRTHYIQGRKAFREDTRFP